MREGGGVRGEGGRWGRRIARAEELVRDMPAAAQLLEFYAELARAQRDLLSDTSPWSASSARPPVRGRSVLDLIVPDRVADAMPGVLACVARRGPPALRQRAGELRDAGTQQHARIVRAFCAARGRVANELTPSDAFFAHAAVQPFAEALAAAPNPEKGSQDVPAACPACGADPLVGVLRDAGQGARRSLLCAVCFTEWAYRRVLCAACGEDRFDALPVYTAVGPSHVRVDACDSCGAYLKSVDLTKEGRAVPEVDDLATAALDLWAAERGYHRLVPNLLRV